jgi:hypothetical protein
VGLIRKTLSVTTLGAVDFRSDKERTAAYTKATRKEARKQTKLMQQATSIPPPPLEESLSSIRDSLKHEPKPGGLLARMQADTERRKAEQKARKEGGSGA